jgi:hypothetical protein
MLKITAAVNTVTEMIEMIPLQIAVKTTQLFVMKDGIVKVCWQSRLQAELQAMNGRDIPTQQGHGSHSL